MELHQLRCFVAAAEELHFGRAAQRLEMLPSALGRYIRLLEDDLGTRLMTRTTRSVTLTDDGAVLLKEARTLLARRTVLRSGSTQGAASKARPSAWAQSIARLQDSCRCCCTIFASAGRMSR
jgi:DNA-binding transcriptional LysR family regulator